MPTRSLSIILGISNPEVIEERSSAEEASGVVVPIPICEKEIVVIKRKNKYVIFFIIYIFKKIEIGLKV